MNFSNKFCPKNRKTFLLSLILAGLLIISFPFYVKAGLADIIGGFFSSLPILLVITILLFFLLLSQIGALLAGAILNWVTSPGFISLSYTSPAGPNANPIIAIGLDITKNFINLALVVILVYIAVAVALRLEGEGAAKKLLTRLILIALLVNFGPVIVGLIVDAANIVMNYFLEGIGMGISDVLTQIITFSSPVASKSTYLPSLKANTAFISRAAILLAVNLATAAILFLFATLFLFRYIIIWVLVILSPIAFVAWVLPATKKYWDMWWQQLIQWSIIGIVAAFFIYLGARAYEVLPAYFIIKMEMPGIEPEAIGTLNQVLPYFVVSIFLFLGFSLGLSTSAMGATAAIGLTKKAGAWTGKKVWGGVKPLAEEKMHLREAAGAVTRKWEQYRVARWFLPEKMRKYAEFRPAVMAAKEDLSAYSSKEIAHRMVVKADYGTKAVGGMMELLSRGDMQDMFEAYKKKYYGDKKVSDQELTKDPRFRKEMGRKLKIALGGGLHNQLLRGDPRLARAAAGLIPGYEGLIDEQAVAKAATEARPTHIANWEKEVLYDEDVVEHTMGKGRDNWQAITSQVKKGRETALGTIDMLYSDFLEKNPEVLKEFKEIEKEIGKIRSEAKKKIALEVDVVKKDKIREEVEERVRKLEESPWHKFREGFREKHEGNEGYFLYLQSPRAIEQGWRMGQYLTPEQRKAIRAERRGEKPAEPEAPTPGAAAGVPPPPPPPETGKKERKAPETGEEGARKGST